MLPNYGDKYEAEALFSPEDAIAEQGEGVSDVPPAIILGYQSELTEAAEERADSCIELVRSQSVAVLSETVGYVPVHESGVGAPVTATITENLIATGAEVIVMLGGCAALQTDIPPDAAILPTDAIRDEGVSYHYLPTEASVTPTAPLVETLQTTLSDAGFETPQGTTWTTSAMYRETLPEIEHYRDTGVVSLCMESAAIWAVCDYRGADTATVHQIGDYLALDGWIPETEADRGLVAMLEPTVDGIERYLAGQ